MEIWGRSLYAGLILDQIPVCSYVKTKINLCEPILGITLQTENKDLRKQNDSTLLSLDKTTLNLA